MSSSQTTSLFAACCALLVASGVGASDSVPYVSAIPADRADPEGAPLGSRISVDVVTNHGDALATMLEGTTIEVAGHNEKSVVVILDGEAVLGGAPQAAHRQASFVIDFDEAPVQALSEKLGDLPKGVQAVERLEAFVFEWLSDKSYDRGFDIASLVAQTGKGDCTEHAVLLTALARAAGYPARAVVGVLVLAPDSGVAAFGHAWTEVYVNNRWLLFDATRPPGEPTPNLYYLPVGGVDNEGPGFAFGLINHFQLLPRRLSNIH